MRGLVSSIGTLWEPLRNHSNWTATALRWWDVSSPARRVMFTISVSTAMEQFLRTSGRSCGQCKWWRVVCGEISTTVATTPVCLLITTPQRMNTPFLSFRMLGSSQKPVKALLPTIIPPPTCPLSTAVLEVPIIRLTTPLVTFRPHGTLSILTHKTLLTTTV
jgi:hypothetical protein